MFKVTAAAVVLSVVGFSGLAHAQSAGSPQSPSAIRLADDSPEIQSLRAVRKQLNEAKDAFDKQSKDADNHRQEVLDGIDKAINAIDSEIDELKKKA
jgi:hypothetical protein